jgi:hypothetical protein
MPDHLSFATIVYMESWHSVRVHAVSVPELDGGPDARLSCPRCMCSDPEHFCHGRMRLRMRAASADVGCATCKAKWWASGAQASGPDGGCSGS